MKPTEALKPCPFCGSPAMVREGPNGTFDVVCTADSMSCGVWPETDLYRDEGEARRIWNTRAALAPEPVAGEAEAMDGGHQPIPMRPELQKLFDEAKAWFDGLSAEEQEAHLRKQRESWVRGEMGMGSDRDEAEYRARLGSDNGGGDAPTPSPAERGTG